MTAEANGSVVAHVAVGESVELAVRAEVPPGAGTIIAAAWDYGGTGEWVPVDGIDGTGSVLHVTVRHAYEVPGTYFPAVQVVAHRRGDVVARTGRIENVGRVRVVIA